MAGILLLKKVENSILSKYWQFAEERLAHTKSIDFAGYESWSPDPSVDVKNLKALFPPTYR